MKAVSVFAGQRSFASKQRIGTEICDLNEVRVLRSLVENLINDLVEHNVSGRSSYKAAGNGVIDSHLANQSVVILALI